MNLELLTNQTTYEHLQGFQRFSLAFASKNIIFVKKNQSINFYLKLKKMNKAELIDAMAAESGMTKADAKKSLDSFMSATANALKGGERVALVGFGTFSVSDRAARKGRNPQTGKEIKIDAKKVVKFKAGNELSTSVK